MIAVDEENIVIPAWVAHRFGRLCRLVSLGVFVVGCGGSDPSSWSWAEPAPTRLLTHEPRSEAQQQPRHEPTSIAGVPRLPLAEALASAGEPAAPQTREGYRVEVEEAPVGAIPAGRRLVDDGRAALAPGLDLLLQVVDLPVEARAALPDVPPARYVLAHGDSRAVLFDAPDVGAHRSGFTRLEDMAPVEIASLSDRFLVVVWTTAADQVHVAEVRLEVMDLAVPARRFKLVRASEGDEPGRARVPMVVVAAADGVFAGIAIAPRVARVFLDDTTARDVRTDFDLTAAGAPGGVLATIDGDRLVRVVHEAPADPGLARDDDDDDDEGERR